MSGGQQVELKRNITLPGAVALVVGAVIGAGIYVMVGEIGHSTGSAHSTCRIAAARRRRLFFQQPHAASLRRGTGVVLGDSRSGGVYLRGGAHAGGLLAAGVECAGAIRCVAARRGDCGVRAVLDHLPLRHAARDVVADCDGRAVRAGAFDVRRRRAGACFARHRRHAALRPGRLSARHSPVLQHLHGW
jgi:hypothetical protein